MGVTEAEREGLINAVRAAARTEILPRFRRLAPSDLQTKSSATDLVTIADRASERSISEAVLRLMPDAAIVGEEAVADDPAILDRLKKPGRIVVIDPIDGTWNFASGLATFGVILAVIEDGQTCFGMLYDPVMDDWVIALRGRGAWFCRPGEPAMQLSGPPPRAKAEAHAFVPLFLYPPSERARLAAKYPDWGRVMDLRCSCHEYRAMAFGHADLIVSPGPKPWDHAAGILVIEELGGTAYMAESGYKITDTTSNLAVVGNTMNDPSWRREFW